MEVVCLLRQAEPKQAHRTISASLKSRDSTYQSYLTKVYIEAIVADCLQHEKEFNESMEANFLNAAATEGHILQDFIVSES